MQLPDKCPICQGVMLIEFNGARVIIKSCRKNITHSIVFVAEEATNEVMELELLIGTNPEIIAEWVLLQEESLTIVLSPPALRESDKPKPKRIALPFFQPDFTDYHKLINKLKTYLVFS
jgi:hypothetical protein